MPDIASDGHSTMPTEPGWYYDPEGRYSHQAYWVGEKWTGKTRPAPFTPSQHRRWVFTVVASATGLLAWYWWALWATDMLRTMPEIGMGEFLGYVGVGMWLVYGLRLLAVPIVHRSSGLRKLIVASTVLLCLTWAVFVLMATGGPLWAQMGFQ